MSFTFPEGRIDFIGQQRVDNLARIWLIGTTVIAFLLGFVQQSLQLTFGFFGGSTVLLALLVVPPWPMFNQHPVQWLPIRGSETAKEKKE
ncbi:microsomal signal peptidase 12kDa subunit [Mycena amicta]|nr:microsomal signal peptidase 12kDa subunit [Mycena amicta]